MYHIYLYIYVCIYIYIHIYIYTCTYIHIVLCMYVFTRLHVTYHTSWSCEFYQPWHWPCAAKKESKTNSNRRANVSYRHQVCIAHTHTTHTHKYKPQHTHSNVFHYNDPPPNCDTHLCDSFKTHIHPRTTTSTFHCDTLQKILRAHRSYLHVMHYGRGPPSLPPPPPLPLVLFLSHCTLSSPFCRPTPKF